MLCGANGRCDIGICIRRLRIHVDRSQSSANLDSGHSPLPPLFRTCNTDCESILLDKILPLLPNLSILDFSFPVSPKVISRLSECSVRHLRFGGGVSLPPTSIFPPIASGWLLESLVLHGVESSLFTFELLNQLSGSLQHLSWKESSDVEAEGVRTLGSFTELRSLVLISSAIPLTVLSSLIPLDTRLASLSVDITSPVGTFLASCRFIPTLEHLCFTQSFQKMDDESLDNLIAILTNNSHITALTIDNALPSSFIDSKLIPCLSSSLRKLNLVWDSNTISIDVLSQIAALLPLLSDLSLSSHSSHLWNVNHQTIIDALKPLNGSLERISFLRDSYYIDSHPLRSASVDGYYISKPFPLEVDFEVYLTKDEAASLYCTEDVPYDIALQVQRRLIDLAWERWHRHCMVSYAKAYAKVFRNMRGWFGGQIGVEMEQSEVVRVDGRRIVLSRLI